MVTEIHPRIEELRKLREWLTSSDDVETAEEIAELLSSLEYPSQGRKLLEIAKREVLGDEPDAQRLKEMHRIAESVIRKLENPGVPAAPPSSTARTARKAPRKGRRTHESTGSRLELLGYLLFFLLGFLAGRYFG